jgi:hypothetical protein
MATKDLSRSVIEGGRTSYSCWQRRHSHRVARACERNALSDGSDWDDLVIAKRPFVWRVFDDKLSPAERYLDAQVGRPWNKVRSELFARFDMRTTAGRHILFDHLLRDVKAGEHQARARYEVDRRGILRRAPPHPRRREVWQFERPEWLAWLQGRRVGRRGGVLFWFLPTPHERLRQAASLDPDESAHWNALPDWFRQREEIRFVEVL